MFRLTSVRQRLAAGEVRPREVLALADDLAALAGELRRLGDFARGRRRRTVCCGKPRKGPRRRQQPTPGST